MSQDGRDDSIPNFVQKRNGSTKTAIDLFCGCGGISAGLRMADYDIIAGVDIDPKYLISFTENFTNARSLNVDINNVDPRELSHLIDICPGELDLLVGGPPCQGFSKNVPRKNRFLEDENNRLIDRFLDYALFFRPPVILMENVAEMRRGFRGHYTNRVMNRLESAGYIVSHFTLNSADYGIPQRRRRAFFVANLHGLILTEPKPTHTSLNNDDSLQMELLTKTPHVSVWDAIGDLPSLRHGEGDEVTILSEPTSDYQREMRLPSGRVENHVARKLRPLQLKRITALEAGQAHKDLPQELQINRGGYSGAYGRLTKNMVAPTITRWVFHPGSGRFGHPVDNRTLTIREAARIQGFPDQFVFYGSFIEQSGQIGNAVPPLLAHKIVMHIENELRS